MNPPLRSEKDRLAIVEGLSDGTIDIIATDHAPHSRREKDLPFEQAAFGIVGLETAVCLSLKLVQDNHITLDTLISKLSKNPAKLLGIDNDIKPGNIADITIIDPAEPYEIRSDQFESKSRNTPFDGMKVIGAPVVTMVKGTIIYTRHAGLVSPGQEYES
jgi:dihydroorotase